MAKKLKVNEEACIGCGLCVGTLPDVFAFNDDGKATAVAAAEDDGAAAEAVANCPVGAIEEE
ncbi:MAG: ferredoxin [Bacilli bacterium]|nr:ferredoxin [Bacilli bacterium]